MATVVEAITPKKFFNVNSSKLKLELRKNMKAYADSMVRKLQEYPPQQTKSKTRLKDFETLKPGGTGRARSPYKRTQALHDGWKAYVAPDGSQGIVFNNAVNKGRSVSYAFYVQGPHGRNEPSHGKRKRADNRSRGWKSVTDVARETKKEFTTVVNRAILSSSEQGRQ